jgi:hypothetical protein
MSTGLEMMKRSRIQCICGFCVQPKIFFIDGIRKLVKQSDTRMEKLGDYVDGW